MSTPRNDERTIRWELLALRCRRGDAGAFAELVREWERPLVYYIRRVLGDGGAEWDVLQEVWLRAFRGIGSLREPRSLSVWLYRIAHHVLMRHLREKYADPAAEVATDFDAAEVAIDERLHFTPEDAEQVHRALKQLPVSFREVLTLHFLEGMTVQQVAEVLGVPPGTVKSRLYHARRTLRELLERNTK